MTWSDVGLAERKSHASFNYFQVHVLNSESTIREVDLIMMLNGRAQENKPCFKGIVRPGFLGLLLLRYTGSDTNVVVARAGTLDEDDGSRCLGSFSMLRQST